MKLVIHTKSIFMHRIIPFLKRVIGPALSPKKTVLTPHFLTVGRQFLENEVRENHRSESTKKKYNTFLNNLVRFLKSRDQEHLPIDQVDITLMLEFKTWLHKSLKSCSLTNSAKHIETCKRILDNAVLLKYIPFNPISAMKTKRDKVKEVINLEPEEITKIEKAIFVCDEYYLIRDLYLFQCYTGLSYVDLWRYQVEKNVIVDKGIKREILLVTSTGGRGKTGKKYWSELTKPAKYIHDKYKGQFPVIDNARYNRYLKELMHHIGIKKYLTTHTGRKTFATVKDQEGYSMPVIAGMLGNTESVARTAYVNENKKKILNEIHRIKKNRPGTDPSLN